MRATTVASFAPMSGKPEHRPVDGDNPAWAAEEPAADKGFAPREKTKHARSELAGLHDQLPS
jgi:hypothetical protein